MKKILEEQMQEILDLLAKRDFSGVIRRLDDMNAVDIAEMMEEVPDESLLVLFRLLPKDLAAETFSEMETDLKQKLIDGFTDQELSQVLDEMYADDVSSMIEEMPANVVNKVLDKTSAKMRADVNSLLKYPKDSAGALMTTEYVAQHADTTITNALQWIRDNGDECEDVYTCYVISEDRKLIGVASLRDLLVNKSAVVLADIMEENVISVETSDDQEDVAHILDKYSLRTVPVVDTENRLVGIVTIDDAVDVLQQENSEDFEIMAAMAPKTKTYFNTTVLENVKNRLPWLLILMFTSILTGLIIEKYEIAFATLPVLVALMPMLSDTGGNCGSQASTLVIRGMAVDEIELRDFPKVLWKEFRVSIIIGISLAVINGIRILIQYQNPTLAVIIALTLVCVVIMAKCLGCILPMGAKALHLDPAIMASPLLTTFVDVFSVWIYFSIASELLGLN